VRGESVVERFVVNVLGVIGQVRSDGNRKIGVRWIRH
jgi:hypothetical protein